MPCTTAKDERTRKLEATDKYSKAKQSIAAIYFDAQALSGFNGRSAYCQMRHKVSGEVHFGSASAAREADPGLRVRGLDRFDERGAELVRFGFAREAEVLDAVAAFVRQADLPRLFDFVEGRGHISAQALVAQELERFLDRPRPHWSRHEPI